MRRWVLLVLLAQVVERHAAAASLSVAPASPCLDATELTVLVERELGTPLGAAVPLRFEVSDAKRTGGYAARLDVFDDRGAGTRHRVVEAADCATLQEVVAVAMTLALSDAGSARGSAATANERHEPKVSSVPPRATGHDASPREESAEIPATRDMDAWVPSFSAGLLLDAGTLPSASLGATVAAALGVGRLQIRALGTLLFEREVISIWGNDELERVEIQGPSEFGGGDISIGENAKLRSVGSAGGCSNADRVNVTSNPSLESVDLDGIPALDELIIRDNPLLSEFAHTSLQRVDIVEIVNNPQLSIAPLAAIPAFERIIEGTRLSARGARCPLPPDRTIRGSGRKLWPRSARRGPL